MAKKSKKTKSSEKELRAKLKKVRAQRDSAEKTAEKWKARAKKHGSEARALEAELSAVRRRLVQAEAASGSAKAPAKAAAKAPAKAAAEAPTKTPAKRSASPTTGRSAPDESWTITRLRAEARTRGVPGYSRQTKAQLLTALRG